MDWQNEARRVFKAELVRRGVTYEFLAWRLQQTGVNVSRPGNGPALESAPTI